MCRDRLPSLDPRAAADRIAERYDVPELSAGLLGRERDRQAEQYRQMAADGRWLTIEAPASWPGPGFAHRFAYGPAPWGPVGRPEHLTGGLPPW